MLEKGVPVEEERPPGPNRRDKGFSFSEPLQGDNEMKKSWSAPTIKAKEVCWRWRLVLGLSYSSHV